MGQYRLLKLGEQIRGEIANMILRAQIKDPRVSNFLTINRVEVAKDLAHAKVYVSTFMSESELNRGVEGLSSAAGFTGKGTTRNGSRSSPARSRT